MRKRQDGYQVVPFPKMRHAIIDHLHEARRKHMIHALAEVDVTKARQIIREHKTRTGESLSFTAFIITCLGRAVDECGAHDFIIQERLKRKRLRNPKQYKGIRTCQLL